MNFKLEEIEIENLDHLEIVAGIIDEIGIVERVNELLGTDSRKKINCGEVVKAIILNGLGFVAQPHRNKDETSEQKLEVNRENPMFITEGYSRDHRADLKWISRVPLSIKKAKDLVEAVKDEELKASDSKGYSYLEERITSGGIEQRWVIVESEERKNSDLKKILNRLEKEFKEISRKINKVIQQDFEEKRFAIEKLEAI